MKSRSPLAWQAPWRQVENPFAPLAPLSEDELAFVQDRSLRVLEEIGVEFLHEGALARLAAAIRDRLAGQNRLPVVRARRPCP